MPEIPPGLHLKGTPSAPRGRSLTAARPFAPGAAIALFGSPSIAIPDSSSLHEVCNHCLLPRGGVGGADAGADAPVVRACTGCRTVTYCGPACQKADWALVHKGECKVFKRVRAEGHDFLPTSVRALVQMHLREDMRAAAAEMEGHVAEFRAQKEVWRNMELQAMAALHYLGQEANPGSVGMAVEMLCKVWLYLCFAGWPMVDSQGNGDDELLTWRDSCKSTRLAGWIKILSRRACSSARLWPW